MSVPSKLAGIPDDAADLHRNDVPVYLHERILRLGAAWHRYTERECNGTVPENSNEEARLRKRLAEINGEILEPKDFYIRFQGDPRGCPLEMYRGNVRVAYLRCRV